MKILQFGATGQVSRAMIAAAEGRVALTALSRAQTDLEDPRAVRAAVLASDCDLVVNCAAFTHVDRSEAEPDAAFAANARAPEAMARACAERDIPLVHLSTDYVFDGAKPRPYVEDDAPNPLSLYGRSKLEGERAVLAWSRGVVLRVAWVFSPFARNFVRVMLELGRARARLSIVADQTGSPTDAAALARFIVDAAPRWTSADLGDQAFGLFHFANAGATTRLAFAQAALARDPKTRAEVSPVAMKDYPETAARPINSALDNAKLARVFGVRPEPWKPAVERAADQIIQAGF